jgi:hypothetical protein
MAITVAQQTELYKLAVGMFNAAPGLTYIDALAQAINAGMSITQIYNQLSTLPEFQGQGFGFTDASTNDQFAAAFIDKLLGSTVTSANRTIAINFVVAQLNAGQSRGQAMQTAITALDAIPSTDPNFGQAAQLFDNRVEVARHFTEVVGATTTDLNVLRNAIAPVTADVASVITTENANLTQAGTQFTLKTDPDVVTGTSFADTINGFIDTATPANSTFTAADVVNGGGQTDQFKLTVTGTAAAALPAAQVSNTEQFFIRDLNTGGASTYDFSLFQGETLVVNDRSTQSVIFNSLAAGTTVQVQGDGVTKHGTTTFKTESNTQAVTINVDGKVLQGDIIRNNTGAATIVVNSTGGDNTVGLLNLDTAAALTGLTINASGGDLTGTLDAADFAASSKLTVTGANDVDLLGAALAANITTVDASAQTGGSTKVLLGGVGTSFTGGAGNDVVAVDALVFNAAGKLDGGTGINTVRVSDAAALTAATAANMTNFQVLRLADDNDGGNDTFNTSLITGIVAVEIDAMAGGDFVTVNNLNATRASAVTIRGSQANGPVFGVTGATTVGQLDVLGISINDGLTAKNTITVADVTAAGVETVNFNNTDNLTLSAITGLTALTNMNVTGVGNFSLTTGALALNVNTQINASGATGTVTIDASAATANGAALVGSLTKVNTITGTAQADVVSGGSANDTFKAGNGVDTVNISQGGDDTINIEGIIAAGNRDNVTGFGAGTFTTGSGNDRLEVADAQVTFAFDPTTGTFQTITSAPTATTTFTTATANVLELAFDLTGNGGVNDLDSFTDGTGLLASLGQTVAVSADQNAGYIIAYQEGKAYLYRAAESNDAGADLAAADITLVGRFDAVAVGAFDATNFIDAV